MKLLNLVTLKEFKQDISDSLKNADEIKIFSFSNIEEHSDHRNLSTRLSKIDMVVGHVSKIKLEVIVQEEHVEKLKKCLFEIAGLEKNSYHWLVNVEELSF